MISQSSTRPFGIEFLKRLLEAEHKPPSLPYELINQITDEIFSVVEPEILKVLAGDESGEKILDIRDAVRTALENHKGAVGREYTAEDINLVDYELYPLLNAIGTAYGQDIKLKRREWESSSPDFFVIIQLGPVVLGANRAEQVAQGIADELLPSLAQNNGKEDLQNISLDFHYVKHCYLVAPDISGRISGRDLAAIDLALAAILQPTEELANKSFGIVRSADKSAALIIASEPGLSQKQLTDKIPYRSISIGHSDPDDCSVGCDIFGRQSLFQR